MAIHVTTQQVADVGAAADLIDLASDMLTSGFTKICDHGDFIGGTRDIENARTYLCLARSYCELAKQVELADSLVSLERTIAAVTANSP